MAIQRNALKLYDAQKAKFLAMTGTIEEAWDMLPQGAEEDAKELLSGTTTTRELIRQGHPYARKTGPVARYDPRGATRNQLRRGGRGTARPLPINAQSRRLINSLRRYKTRVPGALSAERVGFDYTAAGRSLFVLSPAGTTRMIARGFWNELKSRWKKRNNAFRTVFVRKQRQTMTKS